MARDWLTLVAGVVVAVVAVGVARWLLSRRLARRWPTAAAEIRPATRPAVATAVLVAVRITLTRDMLPDWLAGALSRLVTLALIAAVTWLIVEVVNAFTDIYLNRLSRRTAVRHLRRTRTQVTLLRRTAGALVTVIGAGAMLFTFPAMRALGTGVLASAGIIGVVAGIAAQSTLGNLFAGLQIAFSDALRIGDSVVVREEYGTVEELTLTYVTVRTWDERRLIMPVSYFTQTPFENWTKDSNELLGTVYLRVDWNVPVADLRAATRSWLETNDNWDGREWSLLVTDVLENGLVEVRAMVSAADADAIWTLRCELREFLIGHLRDHHNGALPRIRFAPFGAGSLELGGVQRE